MKKVITFIAILIASGLCFLAGYRVGYNDGTDYVISSVAAKLKNYYYHVAVECDSIYTDTTKAADVDTSLAKLPPQGRQADFGELNRTDGAPDDE